LTIQTAFAAKLATVDGSVRREKDARVSAGVQTIRGKLRLENGADVAGGLRVRGTLNFGRPVRLYVSDRATIGPVQGATPIRFSGDQP
jgi:hypothetical protein